MIEEVTRAIIRALRAEVLENTVTGTHDSITELAQLPVLILFAPDIVPVRADDSNEPRVEKDTTAGTARVYGPPLRYNLQYSFEIAAEKVLDVLGIAEKMMVFLAKTPCLQVGDAEYPVLAGEITAPARAGDAIRRVAGRFTVEGVVDSEQYREVKLAQKVQLDFNRL